MALYWRTGIFGGIDYEDLNLQYRPTRFIEDDHVPSDARQIDETWRYVRKDGGPDLRFNNNRRIPVMQYGALALTSSKGLNILLNVSSVGDGSRLRELSTGVQDTPTKEARLNAKQCSARHTGLAYKRAEGARVAAGRLTREDFGSVPQLSSDVSPG